MVADSGQPNHSAIFRTTHWSLVLTAQVPGSSDAYAALTRLCQAYWYPLYVVCISDVATGELLPSRVNIWARF